MFERAGDIVVEKSIDTIVPCAVQRPRRGDAAGAIAHLQITGRPPLLYLHCHLHSRQILDVRLLAASSDYKLAARRNDSTSRDVRLRFEEMERGV